MATFIYIFIYLYSLFGKKTLTSFCSFDTAITSSLKIFINSCFWCLCLVISESGLPAFFPLTAILPVSVHIWHFWLIAGHSKQDDTGINSLKFPDVLPYDVVVVVVISLPWLCQTGPVRHVFSVLHGNWRLHSGEPGGPLTTEQRPSLEAFLRGLSHSFFFPAFAERFVPGGLLSILW